LEKSALPNTRDPNLHEKLQSPPSLYKTVLAARTHGLFSDSSTQIGDAYALIKQLLQYRDQRSKTCALECIGQSQPLIS
jgi:hypothetical protein